MRLAIIPQILASSIVQRKWIILYIMVGVYTVLFTFLCVLRYQSFYSDSWETIAMYNQMLWNIVHGNGPYNSIDGGYYYNHFTPALYFIAMIYFFHPHIFTLFFITSLSLASGAIPLFILARKVSNSDYFALVLSLMYLISPLLHFLNFVDFRPLILSVSILIWTFYFFYDRNFLPFFVCCLLLIFCYETLALAIMFFGVYAFFLKRQMKWCVVPIVLGASWFFLSITVMLPMYGYKPLVITNWIGTYSIGGAPQVLGGLWAVLPHIFNVLLHRFLENEALIRHVILHPFFLLSFCSPGVFLVAIPTGLQILFDKYPTTVGSGHYLAPLVACLSVGMVFGAQRLCQFLKQRVGLPVANSSLLTLLFLVLVLGLGSNRYGVMVSPDKIFDHRFVNVKNVFDPIFYIQDDQDKIASRLLKLIPAEASVCTSGDLLPQLSHRFFVYEFRRRDLDLRLQDGAQLESGAICATVEYIFLRTRSIDNGPSTTDFDNSLSVQKAAGLVNKGLFEYLIQEGDFILLRNRKIGGK